MNNNMMYEGKKVLPNKVLIQIMYNNGGDRYYKSLESLAGTVSSTRRNDKYSEGLDYFNLTKDLINRNEMINKCDEFIKNLNDDERDKIGDITLLGWVKIVWTKKGLEKLKCDEQFKFFKSIFDDIIKIFFSDDINFTMVTDDISPIDTLINTLTDVIVEQGIQIAELMAVVTEVRKEVTELRELLSEILMM